MIQFRVDIECVPDSKIRHKYHGKLQFSHKGTPKSEIFFMATFNEDGNLFFVFRNRGQIIFQFDQANVENIENTSKAFFESILVGLALEGLEGSSAMAERFYEGVIDTEGRDCGPMLASIVSFSTIACMNLTPLSVEHRAYVVQRLSE
jgi:hypothetical protein